MLIVEDQALQSQVDRILHSDELRTSEVLRRLLKFLADKSLAGEADQLKEYAVAIDGLGSDYHGL
jgi:phosphohistidine phosphatase SixA